MATFNATGFTNISVEQSRTASGVFYTVPAGRWLQFHASTGLIASATISVAKSGVSVVVHNQSANTGSRLYIAPPGSTVELSISSGSGTASIIGTLFT